MLDKRILDSMIRINHAGEFAAKRIYEGQLRFIKDIPAKALIQTMAEGEKKHLEYFENEIKTRKVRPTALYHIVDKVAYGLGAITGIMGTNASMLCTAAVEDAIVEHYQEQITALDGSQEELRSAIQKFSDEELEHKHVAEKESSEGMNQNSIMYKFINSSCKLAIKVVRYI